MSHSYLDQGSIAAGQHFVVGSLQLALPLDFVIASVRRLENRVLGELQLFWFDSFDQFHIGSGATRFEGGIQGGDFVLEVEWLNRDNR